MERPLRWPEVNEEGAISFTLFVAALAVARSQSGCGVVKGLLQVLMGLMERLRKTKSQAQESGNRGNLNRRCS